MKIICPINNHRRVLSHWCIVQAFHRINKMFVEKYCITSLRVLGCDEFLCQNFHTSTLTLFSWCFIHCTKRHEKKSKVYF